MYYYHHNGAVLASFEPQTAFGPEISPAADARIFFLVHGDPVLGRGHFKVTHPGQLTNPHGLEGLDASRLTAPVPVRSGSICWPSAMWAPPC